MPNVVDKEIKKDSKKNVKDNNIKDKKENNNKNIKNNKKASIEKSNEDNNKKNVVKKSKKKTIFILIFFLFSIFVIGISIFMFNIFNIKNISSKNILLKLPILKNVIHSKKNNNENNNKISKKDLISKIDSLEIKIKKYETELKDTNELNSIYASEILRLKELESLYAQFKNDKENFDRMIAKENNLKFTDFYKSIYPENAENLYKEILNENKFNKEFKNFIDTFENMDKNKAAKVLENMITSDINLVASILNNISVEKRSDIISSMECNNATIVVKSIVPEESKRK